MPVREEILSANEDYASSFTKGELPIPPARRFAVVTCMDARIDPARALGLEEGDAHVIRNAGGLVSDDALRSLVISHHLLGVQEAIVIGHEGCGMLTFTNDDLHGKLGADADDIDFLPFGDLDQSVRSSVRRIEESPLLPDSFTATGFVYDVTSGRLREV
ncbi:MAG TPA: carbonic anhydrase [Gaiellaceae bacterium]|nr:carbonic anhydrase [Gaiellaceae bacterium]